MGNHDGASADEGMQLGVQLEENISSQRFFNQMNRMEETLNQQGLINQTVMARLQELGSQLQELKRTKDQATLSSLNNGVRINQGILGAGSRDERGIPGSDNNNQIHENNPQTQRRIDLSGECPPTPSQNHGNFLNHKNSFFSNQKLVQPKSLRLDFPSFSGSENVISWLEQIEQIFDYYDIKEDEWVKVCSFYLRDEALQWFRWFTKNLDYYNHWKVFKEEIITRFGPSELLRPYDTFSTMKQTSTVREYLGKFEKTLSLLDDQPSKRHILEKIIGGLKDELRYEVAAARPPSLKGAVSLAKLFEDKQKNEKKVRGNWNVFNQGSPSTRTSIETPVQERLKSSPQVKKLTPEEIQRRRSQNICFTCDEKWHRGHQCKDKRLFILEGIMTGVTEEDVNDSLEEEAGHVAVELAESLLRGAPSISVQAFSGITASHTIRIVGYYKNQAISILIDSGSTHNFINSKLVKKLGLTVTEYSNFDVLVASGEVIKGAGVCQEVSLDCQGVNIQVNLLVMPMGGSQIVLGADWMKTLEDITLNFQKLQVTFLSDGIKRTLQGEIPGEMQLVNEKSIAKSVREHGQGFLIQLCSVSLRESKWEGFSEELPEDMHQLIQEFDVIFQELPHLPPAREIDHRIPLEPGTKPVCIRPYRHAHFLKEEIEKQIEEMLRIELSRAS
ncbi:uncharacterized protein LOC109834681 [Asparagus officinalis]|uniref:uncharacterized protein LOC109834681 n=1 Tax=Asparagus officinalis TaxID=4686 RepID=UPI00098E109F|nr:uncharacterized protein LOC109834681 [Asparagus officinalis]